MRLFEKRPAGRIRKSHTDRRTLQCWYHLKRRFGHLHCLVQDAVEIGIAVAGVMMERHQTVDIGEVAEDQRLIYRAMAPSAMAGIFRAGILAVVYQQIGFVGELRTRCPSTWKRRKAQDTQRGFVVG